MRKILYLYWYVPPTYWHPVYNLHLRNLKTYRDIFDEIKIIISSDEGNSGVNKTIESMYYILPNAEFIQVKNDKEQRESAFFNEYIVKRLGDFDDNTAIFFAHNKGVDTTYTRFYDRNAWIDAMYYFNLSDKDLINRLLSDSTTCAIGTGKINNYVSPVFESFCAHRWIFAGTFFWIVPKRINEYIKEHGVQITPNTGRYYTEGFLGMIFPQDAEEIKCIGGDKVEYETWSDYIERNLTNDNVDDYVNAHGTVYTNRDIDIFVFTHKNFETERTNPTYKIVCSNDCDIKSDKLGVIKLDCRLSNVGFSEWQKIYELYTKRSRILKGYVGLAHYHRYLSFRDDVNFIPKQSEITEVFSQTDVLTKHPIMVGNLRYQYEICHNVKDFDVMMDVIKTDFPDWYEYAVECVQNGLMFDSNIMILKKDNFLKMCDFIFNVLFKYCERVGIDPTSDESFIEYVNTHDGYEKEHKHNNKFNEQARICSYLAERLVVMFYSRYTPRVNVLKMVEK